MESALFKVHNDVLEAVDDRQTNVLLLLDLSDAFNTVDHGILSHQLQSRFGIKAKACSSSARQENTQYFRNTAILLARWRTL